MRLRHELWLLQQQIEHLMRVIHRLEHELRVCRGQEARYPRTVAVSVQPV